jgi:disulfide bond formation protein DsbB
MPADSEAAATDTDLSVGAIDSSMPGRGRWGSVSYWGLLVWVFSYCFVMTSAFYIQLAVGESPCPLCMLQRYGMFLSSLGAVFVIMQARRGTLTASRYAQGLGMGLVGGLAGASVSIRQILLHIEPGDPGYGHPVLGLHLYTWAFITFAIVAIYVGVMLTVMPQSIPVAPAAGSPVRLLSAIIVWWLIALAAANVIAIILLEGISWVLPDNPTGYNLLDQLTGK